MTYRIRDSVNVKTPSFNVFGSPDSIDVDLVIFVNFNTQPLLNRIHFLQKKCKEFERELLSLFSKKINVNLANLENGVIAECFKGTPDELNNAIYYTYHYHDQYFELLVKRPVKRDLLLKVIRCERKVLSSARRTKLRRYIKPTLRTFNLMEYHKCLSTHYEEIVDLLFEDENVEKLKIIAFQVGQTLLLMRGIEVYTKGEIVSYYPQLKQYLYRSLEEPDSLKELLGEFVNEVQPIIDECVFKDNYMVEYCGSVYNVRIERRVKPTYPTV